MAAASRPALLDVNALVALVWDSHVHHQAIRQWFRTRVSQGWATCPVTESGFVRVSANAKAVPAPVNLAAARTVLRALRSTPEHQFLNDDVSITDPDVPDLVGHRQVTDAHLLTLARRRSCVLVTFDSGLATLARGSDDVVLLTAL